jgi:hypothetical protein
MQRGCRGARGAAVMALGSRRGAAVVVRRWWRGGDGRAVV